MSKLFILGNGFDLAHNLPTGYGHFRDFLVSIGDKQDTDYSDLFTVEYGRTGNFVLDQDKIINLLVYLIDETSRGDNWEDFEEATGKFYYEEFFDFCEANKDVDYAFSSLNDEYEDDEYEDDEIDYDDEVFLDSIQAKADKQELIIAKQLDGFLSELKKLFSEWFRSINTAAARKTNFINQLSDNDLFLTFNYTKTLEVVYNIPKQNICHIHGQQGEEIVFGHGQKENPYEKDVLYYTEYEYADKTNMDFAELRKRINIDNPPNYSLQLYLALSSLFNDFKKDVQGCYEKQEWFFKKLHAVKIDSIISLGFSFSEVDRYYIKKICEKIDTSNIVWHLTKFDDVSGKKEKFEKIIRECGFKGAFGELIPDLDVLDSELKSQKKVS